MTSSYNALGQVVRLEDHDGTGISYTYDWNGQKTEEAHSDGSRTTYAYNNAGLLEHMEHTGTVLLCSGAVDVG